MGRRIEEWIVYILIGLFALLPLFFLPIVPTFLYPKITLMRLGSIAIGLLWAMKTAYDGRVVFKRTALDLPILVLMVVATVATLLSLSPLVSFFGEQGRWEGLLTLGNYAFLFFAAVNFLGKERLRALALALVVPASGLAVFATIEHFIGNPIMKMVTAVPGGAFIQSNFESLGRPYATMINPMYLGVYLALAFTVGMGLLVGELERGNRLKATLLLAALGSIGTGLVLSYTRSAWLAAACSIILFGVFGFGRHRKATAVAVTGIVLIVLAGGAVTLQANLAKGRAGTPASAQFNPVARLVSLVKPGESSTPERLKMWRQALELTRRKPALGTGPDTLGIVMQVSNGPHNEFLSAAVTMGIPGLLSALFLWGVLVLSILRYLRRGENILVASFGFALAGYVAYLFFAYSHPTYSPAVWMLMGVFAGSAAAGKERVVRFEARAARTLLAWIAMITAAALVSVSAASLYADYLFYRGLFSQMRSGARVALTDVDRAISLNPYQYWYICQTIRLNLILGQEGDSKAALKAVELADRVEGIAPNDARAFVNLAIDMGEFGKEDQELLGSARRRIDVAIDLTERNGLATGLGGLYARRALADLYIGDKTTALADANKAFDLRPRLAESWLILDKVYRELGKQDRAEACVQRAANPNLSQ